MSKHNVIFQVIFGEITPDQLDEALLDAVEAWHTTKTELAIYEFIGLTHKEYGRWVENPKAIFDIIEERKQQLRSC